MTREEEIKAKSKEYLPDILDGEYSYRAEFVFGFQKGAKWADENPNSNGKELLYVAQKTAERTKKEFISKACEWLEDNLFNYPWYDNEAPNFTINDVMNDFKKAMEL
jgi:hypothetical protein